MRKWHLTAAQTTKEFHMPEQWTHSPFYSLNRARLVGKMARDLEVPACVVVGYIEMILQYAHTTTKTANGLCWTRGMLEDVVSWDDVPQSRWYSLETILVRYGFLRSFQHGDPPREWLAIVDYKSIAPRFVKERQL